MPIFDQNSCELMDVLSKQNKMEEPHSIFFFSIAVTQFFFYNIKMKNIIRGWAQKFS